jgi:thymidylate kinase
MNLESFLTYYLNKLLFRKIPYCILRNYEGLPQNNFSNDIDILIRPGDKFIAIKELLNIDDIKITECCERANVTSLFIYGVNWGANYHAIQIDLITALNWKGLPYLHVENVMEKAGLLRNSIDIIITPYPPHEAIISFFSSFLVGGWIEKRYQSKVRIIFTKHREEIISLLSETAEYNTVLRVVDLVCTDCYDGLIKILPQLRRNIVLQSIINKPIQTIKNTFRYYVREIIIRYTTMYIKEICVFGPDGSGKSSAIAIAKKKLLFATKIIKVRHLKPKIIKITNSRKPSANPHGEMPRLPFISVLKIILWLLEYWIKKVFHGYKNPTLIFWDRYFHDLLVDPYRYRFGAPLIFARIISKFVPQPDLMIFLDAPAKIIQMRKKELSHKEIMRQRKNYLKLSNKVNKGVIIDASPPLEVVVQKLNTEIIGFLAKNKKRQLEYIINKKGHKRHIS